MPQTQCRAATRRVRELAQLARLNAELLESRQQERDAALSAAQSAPAAPAAAESVPRAQTPASTERRPTSAAKKPEPASKPSTAGKGGKAEAEIVLSPAERLRQEALQLEALLPTIAAAQSRAETIRFAPLVGVTSTLFASEALRPPPEPRAASPSRSARPGSEPRPSAEPRVPGAPVRLDLLETQLTFKGGVSAATLLVPNATYTLAVFPEGGEPEPLLLRAALPEPLSAELAALVAPDVDLGAAATQLQMLIAQLPPKPQSA